MNKIFLSHSSDDKKIVEEVAQLLGKYNCIYDKFSFEIGEQTIHEIFRGLDETDIFVYFISNSSLDSRWVREELNNATKLLNCDTHKLSQIFPIILDDTLYTDERIADFLRKDYNLQRVDNAKIAYRKILNQIAKREFEKGSNYIFNCDFFYGRDKEVREFKQRVDNLSEPFLKSIVVSGVPGIGKKSFLRYALREAKITEEYYRPISISLSKNENIEDLILLLSSAGFGDYTLEQIISLKTIDEKIDILVELLNKIQKYKEIVIIEDDECLVEMNGNLRYWFAKALEKTENGIAAVITSNYSLDSFYKNNYPNVFAISLLELDPSDTIGLLRTYSQQQNIEFLRNDLEYLKDCLSGYPMQIIYCVDLAKQESVDYVKNNTHLISQMPDQISASILEKCQKEFDANSYWGILALIAKLDLTPINIINKISKMSTQYRDIIISLKKYSICYPMGSSNEYLKMNSFIRTYVTRNRAVIPKDIHDFLHQKLNDFNDSLLNKENTDLWDLSEIRYFIKENLTKGIDISSNFVYSTILLQTVMELYHNQQYTNVLNIIRKANSDGRLQYFEESMIHTLQRYLCLSLSKNRDSDFESEVQFFAEQKKWADYYFLKGFNARCNGDYEKAQVHLNKVLEFNANHLATKRELVIVYLSLQDFDAAFVLAQSNYRRNKDNLFALQAYFECLLEVTNVDEERLNEELEEMLCSIKNIHRISSTPVYYQLMAKYEFYFNHSTDLAMGYINDGLKKYNNHMYILRDKFDIYRRDRDILGMKNTLIELKKATKDLKYKGIYITRKAILDLFEGKSEQSVRLYLKTEGNFTDKTIENILKKVQNSITK